MGIGQGGPFLWVNQNGERFVDENLGEANFELQTVPGRNQKKMFTVFDSAIFEKWATARGIDVNEALGIFKESLASNEADSFYSANSVEELAAKAGIDEKAFADTVERYNELCARGIDEDPGKDARRPRAVLGLLPHPTQPEPANRIAVNAMSLIGFVQKITRPYPHISDLLRARLTLCRKVSFEKIEPIERGFNAIGNEEQGYCCCHGSSTVPVRSTGTRDGHSG